MKGHVCTRHLGRWLSLLLATLAAGAPGCGVFEGAAEEPPAREGSEHHIASLIRAWFSSLGIVAEPPGAAPAVLRVEHEPLLSFPGTGPQIVCY
jgi:hypothetical protein